MPTTAGRADEAISALSVGPLYDEFAVEEKCKAAAAWLSRCLQANITADRLETEWEKIAEKDPKGSVDLLLEGIGFFLGYDLWEFYREAAEKGATSFVVFEENPESQFPTMYLVAVRGDPSEAELARYVFEARPK